MSENESNEQRFTRLFERLFHGADVVGRPDSGFINLLKMKRLHFRAFFKNFFERVDQIIGDNHADAPEAVFRDEVFDKLHTFFSRYFSESGSVYFRNTPAWQPIYHRVDDPGRDVMLVWKTSMLHYVKTDAALKSMTVDLSSQSQPPAAGVRVFAFDTSEIPPKKNNERRDFVFEYAGISNAHADAVRVKVLPAQNGRKTDFAEVAKTASEKSGMEVNEENLRNAAARFLRQPEADYFINREPQKFLQEQLDLWMFSYALRDKNEFTAGRVAQLRAIREISELVIAFVSEFETQLLRIWEKPKFARGANYVVTADRIPANLLKKAVKSPGAKAQAAEWRELNLVPDDFSMNDLLKGDGALNINNGSGVNGNLRFLPLDTKHFKELQTEILARLAETHGGENAVLDRALDGELIHSENWQALNTILPKFRGRVKCVYIDPPFNLDSGDQFAYRTNYKDSSWTSMLEGRLELARELLAEDGGIFVRCDHHGDHIVHFLMDKIFGGKNLKNPIVVKRGKQTLGQRNMYASATDTLYFYCKDEDSFVFTPFKRKRYQWEAKGSNLLMTGEGNPADRAYDFKLPSGEMVTLVPPPDRRWKFKQSVLDEMQKKGIIYFAKSRNGEDSGVKKIENGQEVPFPLTPSFHFDEDKTVDSNWTDIPGYSADWDFDTENAEILLQRSIGSTTHGLVLDFFTGSGTTIAVAQKLRRKWVGVEMGEHFHTVVLPRMKKTLAGVPSGINKGEDSVDYKGGGAFKYYALEQYEESLAHASYRRDDESVRDENPELVHPPSYMFLRDEKMTWCVEVGEESLDILLERLHPDIDLAETLSHARGLPVKSRTAEEVVLGEGAEDWERETYRIDWKGGMSGEDKAKLLCVLRPYLWW